MDIRARFTQASPTRLVHVVGGALVIAGVLWWGLRWWHIPGPLVTQSSAQTQASPAASAVAKWLGPGEVRLNVVVHGVMVRRSRAVALLSVNDGAPQAFMVGETLLENVNVEAINAGGVVLNNAGKKLTFAAPETPSFPPDGIAHAPGRR